MYLINKIVGTVLSPLGLPMIALLCAAAWAIWRRGWKACAFTSIACVAWLWVWASPVWMRVTGLPLERGWSGVLAEDLPSADAIVVLGGGMGANLGVYPYPNMYDGADRVWHAVRLYRAGKAPLIIPTGCGDGDSTVPLLRDFGVPESAIAGEYKSRNTEENAKFVARLLAERRKTAGAAAGRPRVLLVTSAWHMRRGMLMCEKYAADLEVVPAPADFDFTVNCAGPVKFADFIPDVDAFKPNCYAAKEIIGYWGYRIFR